MCNIPTLLPKRQEEARGLLTAQGLLPSLEFVSVVVIDDDPGFALGGSACNPTAFSGGILVGHI